MRDVEGELRRLGRESEREPPDEVVAAVLARLDGAPRRSRGRFAPLAAAVALVAVVPGALWWAWDDGSTGVADVAATAGAVLTTATSPTSVDHRTPFCTGLSVFTPSSVQRVELWADWEFPTGPAWPEPRAVLFLPAGAGDGTVVATFSADAGAWTVERYPAGSTVATSQDLPAGSGEVPVKGAAGRTASGTMAVRYRVPAGGGATQQGGFDCEGRRLTWTGSSGAVYAITSEALSWNDLQVLAWSLP
ncbi:hypothetical protein [Saccharothrix algeriensis]|uniref:Uncharacterized protein n=1 Tax=Saccharothrix algeriensis TaxID=173560 RepID=A0ABS2S003_9PSEU|nr:hypothetical protein [Saccharothrix algeriensis]MBM7809280.1 hypothetical protein [Saccharothrix algeriensis]